MPTQRIFISFDYGHDDDLRVLLVGQAKTRTHRLASPIGQSKSHSQVTGKPKFEPEFDL